MSEGAYNLGSATLDLAFVSYSSFPPALFFGGVDNAPAGCVPDHLIRAPFLSAIFLVLCLRSPMDVSSCGPDRAHRGAEAPRDLHRPPGLLVQARLRQAAGTAAENARLPQAQGL